MLMACVFVGMGLNKGRTLGKMEFWGRIVLFRLVGTILTSSSLRIRLALICTSLPRPCTGLWGVLELWMFTKELRFLCLMIHPLGTSLCSLVIGTTLPTRCVFVWLFIAGSFWSGCSVWAFCWIVVFMMFLFGFCCRRWDKPWMLVLRSKTLMLFSSMGWQSPLLSLEIKVSLLPSWTNAC